jgi:hypothetical protein
MLLAVIAALLSQSPPEAVSRFHEIAAAEVPAALFANRAELCDALEATECRREFLQRGRAWLGDVNSDGVPELLLQGAVLGGTGGDPYLLFQQRRQSWLPLTAQGGWVTLTGSPRFDILPSVRGGYHDIRVSVDGCFKWNGQAYVPYEPGDFRALSPRWFDASQLAEAELFWAIRYRGAPTLTLDPQWFPAIPRGTDNVDVEDPVLALRWVALFKGGVYGVQGERSFLLLPRPAYRGAERLQLEGEWLVVYATVTTDSTNPRPELQPVARYNRRSKELHVLSHDQ